MKKQACFWVAIALAFSLSGCVYTSKSSFGNPISELAVTNIVKNKTTTSEITTMFGQPTTKSVINDTDEKWIYSHIETEASAQAYTMKNSLKQEVTTLDLLVRNNVVVNYSYSKSNTNPQISTSQKL